MPSSWVPGGQGDLNSTETNSAHPAGGGFWVTHPEMSPDSEGEPQKQANAYLEDQNGSRVFMWVDDVTADFAMTGNTAQSRKRREFYPHNFSQPVLRIHCQTPNSYEYNRIGAFIRAAQRDAVSDGDLKEQPLLRLRINSGGQNTARKVTRGHHNRIAVDGYVTSAPRGAERFVNAPDFEFDFVITKAWNFLGLQDDATVSAELATIFDILGDSTQNWKWETGEPPQLASNGQGNHTESQEEGPSPALFNSHVPENNPIEDPFDETLFEGI